MKFKITAIICAASILLSYASLAIAADSEETGTSGAEPLTVSDSAELETPSVNGEPASSDNEGSETVPAVSTDSDSSDADPSTDAADDTSDGTTDGTSDGTSDGTTDGTSDTSSDGTSDTSSDSDSSSEDDDEPEESVQSIIYRYLTEELELCPAAAAGIMGNVMIECGFDPSLEVIDTNNKPSFGLMMWNGPRYEALKKWCEEHGFDKTDPKGQLGYLKWELENTEKGSYASMKNIPNTAEGAVLAAILWADEFERCTKTSYGLRVYYALNNYWQDYASGELGESEGVYGYYYNVPVNVKFGEPLTLYGAVVSYTSPLKSITAGVYTEDGKLVTGRTMSAVNHVGNIGVIDRFIVMNRLPRGKYYYTITAKNETDEYVVERRLFTVTDEPTKASLIYETEGGGLCEMGASCPSFRFLDMTPITHWAHGDIDFVLANEFFLGNGAGYFLPETNMDRSMFVTVLHRLSDKYSLIGQDEERPHLPVTSEGGSNSENDPEISGSTQSEPREERPTEAASDSTSFSEPDSAADSADVGTDSDFTEADSDGNADEPIEYPFTDVVYDSWYGTHVLWAYENDLVRGKGNGIFDPSGEITRGELAVLMYRVAERSGLDVSDRADVSAFEDAESLPDWAKEEMAWAASAGLINGTVDGGKVHLSTMSLATREQVSAIIRRFAALMENSERLPVTPETTPDTTPAETTPDVTTADESTSVND